MRGNPVVCSRPLCGGPEDIPGVPASEPPRPGLPPWPWRRCWPPAVANPPRTPTSRPAPIEVQVTDASFPTEQHLGQTSLLQLGDPQHRQEDGAGADRDGLDRRQGRPGLVAALRHPRPPARPRPARPPGLGAGRRLPAAGRLLRARRRHDLEPQDLLLRAAEAGRDHGSGLEAERGQSRQVHRCSTGSTPASAAPPRRRPTASPPGGSFVTEITAAPPDTEVTDSGEVVEKAMQRQRSEPGE